MNERLDRDAVARVLARAQEIDTSDLDDAGVTPDALIEAAAEVGIDPDAVRDALALERIEQGAAQPQRLDRLAGPSVVTVERTIPLLATDALDSIEAWLTSVHRLRCERRSETLLIGAKRTDKVASVGRKIASVQGEGGLSTVRSITVDAVQLVAGTTPQQPKSMLRVQVDRGPSRQRRVGVGAAVGAAGIGGASLVAVETVALGSVVAVPLLAGGYFIARSGRGQARSVELEVERLLSLVERGNQPEGIVSAVIGRARDAVRRSPKR